MLQPSDHPFRLVGVFVLTVFLAAIPTTTSATPKTAIASAGAYICDLLSPRRAQQAFQELAARGKAAVPTLQSMLSGRNMRLIRAALDLSAKLDDPTDDLLRELTRIASVKRFGKLRLRAMRVLGAYGRSAGKALPTLTRLLLDANAEMRLAAAESIVDLFAGGAPKLPDVLKQLKDPRSPLRRTAVQLLQTAAPLAHPAAPLLYEYLETGSVRPTRALSLLLPTSSLLNVLAEPLLEKVGVSQLDPHAEAVSDEVDLEHSLATEDDTAEADAAEAAPSFEDVPAQESD